MSGISYESINGPAEQAPVLPHPDDVMPLGKELPEFKFISDGKEGKVFDDFVPNPKTLTGQKKLPILSVIPPASILYEAMAMRNGAFEAPRVDGSKGYGPFNWRDQPVELMTYLDAAMRHILAVIDGEDKCPKSGVHHLGHAKAGLGIVIDALENGTLIDNRPKVRTNAAAKIIARETRT